MPEISRFYEIIVQIFYQDHAPPHFHVSYGGQKAVITIETLSLLEGKLPSRASGLVIEWASMHQPELFLAFEQASQLQPPLKIDPLR